MLHPDPSLIFGRLAEALQSDWRVIARRSQLAPPGDWTVWGILAGRGWGKTRTGAEWVHSQVKAGRRRIALVGATANDVRNTMIEGESGILAVSPPYDRPLFNPSLRRLTWPNGAIATAYSADEPERLRGPQHDAGWCDEIATWRYPDAWDQLQFGLRLGKRPRIVVTTTPRPVKLVRDLVSREGHDVIITRGSTFENKQNLAPAFMSTIVSRYGGTRLGRQELDAELLDDVTGALWRRADIDGARIKIDDLPTLRRVVVAIDPSISSGNEGDECGIVVAGAADNGHFYILDDRSGQFSPDAWAREAMQSYRLRRADRIVAEINQGGAMVESTIRTVDPNVSYRAVHASRGKAIRAEPIAALYEQGRVHHVGSFPILEDQLCGFTSDFDRARAGYSPDRLDALVWALTDLTEPIAGWGIIEFYRREAARILPASGARDAGAVKVCLRPPSQISTLLDSSGAYVQASANGTFMVTPGDATLLLATGWQRVDTGS